MAGRMSAASVCSVRGSKLREPAGSPQHPWHRQGAAGSSLGTKGRELSAELGELRHKVSGVRKARAQGGGARKDSTEQQEKKKNNTTTKEKTVKGSAIMGMRFSFFCPVASCQSLPHKFLSATKTSPHGHTCLETNSFSLEKIWALLQ